MNILIYSHAFSPSIGGIEQNTMRMAEGIALANATVTVVTKTPAGDMSDGLLPFRVVRQPSVTKLLRLIWEADAVYLAGPCFFPMVASLLFRKPAAVKHHGYQSICPNGLLFYEPTKTVCSGHFLARRYSKCLRCNAKTVGWIQSILKLLLTFPRRWACCLVAQNIAVSQHVDGRVGLPRSRVIYHGIADLHRSTPASSHDCPGPSTSPVTFAYVGRLVSEKGLPLLIAAAHDLTKTGHDFRIKVIGGGAEHSSLQHQVNLLGLRDKVIFTGPLIGEALEDALQDAAVLVMPSTWEETFGVSAIEHMMRGRVVIAAAIGGLGEIVEGVGITFPCGDEQELAGCLRRLLDDPGLINELGLTARSHALRFFTQERMIKEHLDMFSEMTVEQKHAA